MASSESTVVSTSSTLSKGIPKSTRENETIKATVCASNDSTEPSHFVAVSAIFSRLTFSFLFFFVLIFFTTLNTIAYMLYFYREFLQ